MIIATFIFHRNLVSKFLSMVFQRLSPVISLNSAIDSRSTGGTRAPPEFRGSVKGGKSEFCLSEFSYYYEH